MPAAVSVTAFHENPREALAAAYLIAEAFCTWAQNALGQPAA